MIKKEYNKICLMLDIYDPILTDSWVEVQSFKDNLDKKISDDSFKEIKPKSNKKHMRIKPDKNLDYIYGWVAPTGDFYGCEYAKHEAIISLLYTQITKLESLSNDAILWAEKNNWIRISEGVLDNNSLFFNCIDFKKVTQSQLNTLFDYSVRHEKMYLYTELLNKMENVE